MPIINSGSGTVSSVELRFTRAELIAALAAADGVAVPDMEEALDSIVLNVVFINEDGTHTFVSHVENENGLVLKMEDYEDN